MYNRFAKMRHRYLREHRNGIYTGMFLDGKLEAHLKEIGEAAEEMSDRLVDQRDCSERPDLQLNTRKDIASASENEAGAIFYAFSGWVFRFARKNLRYRGRETFLKKSFRFLLENVR